MKAGFILLVICVSVIVQYFCFRHQINSKMNAVYERLETLCFTKNAFVLKGVGYVCMPCKECGVRND